MMTAMHKIKQWMKPRNWRSSLDWFSEGLSEKMIFGLRRERKQPAQNESQGAESSKQREKQMQSFKSGNKWVFSWNLEHPSVVRAKSTKRRER